MKQHLSNLTLFYLGPETGCLDYSPHQNYPTWLCSICNNVGSATSGHQDQSWSFCQL